MDIKKILISSLFFYFVNSTHTFLAFADCGDSSLGQFECNTDSIRVTYGRNELQNNNWVNQNPEIESAGSTYVSGPILNLDPGIGEFKSIQVTGNVKLVHFMFMMGRFIADPCAHNVVGNFLVELTANDESNNRVILSQYPFILDRIDKIYNDNTYVFNFNTDQEKGAAELSFPFLVDIPSQQHYKNFQIQILVGTVSSCPSDFVFQERINDFADYILPQNETWYLQLVGIR